MERTIKIEANLPTDFEIEYWYGNGQEMPGGEQEHVKEMLEEGYVEGELNDGNEYRGWWRIEKQTKAH